MNHEKNQNRGHGLEMYFSPEIVEKFAALEQNDRNFRKAQIIDKILLQETAGVEGPIQSAELGGGAHPDRYHEFFARLTRKGEAGGHIDWVDISPYMLAQAAKYLEEEQYRDRKEVISFIESDNMDYLRSIDDEKLDIAIMKYTLDYVDDLDLFFELLSEKLKIGGKLVATIGNLSPELKSYSTNARFLYNGEQFPDDEVRVLKDGDSFTVKFFKVSGDKEQGFLDGAETVKYYHSAEKIRQLAEKNGFDCYLGDWKGLANEEARAAEDMNMDVLVLTKKCEYEK